MSLIVLQNMLQNLLPKCNFSRGNFLQGHGLDKSLLNSRSSLKSIITSYSYQNSVEGGGIIRHIYQKFPPVFTD